MPMENVNLIEWVLPSIDALERATDLLTRITQAQDANDTRELERLKDELTSMPGFPSHQPGDRFLLSVAPRATVDLALN